MFAKLAPKIKPLKKKHTDRLVFRRKRRPISVKAAEEFVDTKIILQDGRSEEIDEREQLFFARSGVQTKTLRKLKQGKLAPVAKIDLHGMTLNEARIALQQFLVKCAINDWRLVLVIHGKGKGILKGAVNTWLRDYPATLAFCSAVTAEGGSGAVYLLLSKKR